MSDMDEPTPWQDINPAMGLAQRREQRLPSSARLQPATNDKFRDELTACLALVAPSGMTEEARRDWLAVAWGTLRHLPADVLENGCRVARQKCDHPAKIVPTILEATENSMRLRRESPSDHFLALPSPSRGSVMDRRGKPMSEEDTETLNGILARLGATARYRPDGSKYRVEP